MPVDIGFSAATVPERIEYIDLQPRTDSFLDDVQNGLAHNPKTLPCKYFYDEEGSELFERITHLPEYYPTRTEIAIMERSVDEMVSRFGRRVRLVELGSGASVKTRILLEATRKAGIQVQYVPIDISRDFLFRTARELADQFPRLSVRAVCADYTQGLAWLDTEGEEVQTVVYFPGSTIGNFTPAEARAFLKQLRSYLRPGDGFLLGTDLKKDRALLYAAYNDREGITARFNLHLLERINDELGADIPVHDYIHEAVYNPEQGRIEMYLRSTTRHTVHLGDREYNIDAGEAILTEYSHKFDPGQVRDLALAAGFVLEETWTDDAGLFGVHWWAVRK